MIFPERSQVLPPKTIYQPYQRGNSDFFEHLSLKGAEKERLRHQIASLRIIHQLDEKTTNIQAGQLVKQILVIEVLLSGNEIEKELLASLDSRMGMFAIFKIVPTQGKERFLIHYKEPSSNIKEGKLYKIIRSFDTESLNHLNYGVNNLDDFYNQLVKEVARDNLVTDKVQDIKSAIDRDQEIKKLEKEAESHKKKMYAAKAMRQQMEYRRAYQQHLTTIETLKKGDEN